MCILCEHRCRHSDSYATNCPCGQCHFGISRGNMLVRKVVGKFGRVWWVTEDGERFRLKRRLLRRNDISVVCVNSDCKAMAWVTFCGNLDYESADVGELDLKKGHSLGDMCKNKKEVQVEILRKRILERARTETKQNSIIFQEEINNAPVEIRNILSFAEIERSMQRAHANANPRSVETLTELATEIENWTERFGKINNNKFFLGLFGSGNEECIIALVTPLLGNGIDLSANWHVDGTFKCRPKKPSIAQLYVIMASQYGRAYPIVWALMKSKSTKAYDVLFETIKEHVPGINPSVIMGDYEKAARASLRRHFPAAKIVGCWFHFSQAIEKNAKKVGINRNDNGWDVVKRLMATALLPYDKIGEAVSVIETFALTTSDSAKASRLIAYFKREWLGVVTAKSFSVFGQSARTNNCQESLNRCINRTITPQGNTWDFWNGIRSVSVKEINYFHQLREGRDCGRRRKNKWLLQDKRIKRQQERLIRGELTLEEFLGATSHAIGNENANSSETENEHQDIEDDADPELDTLDVLEENNEENSVNAPEVNNAGDGPVVPVSQDSPYVNYRVVPVKLVRGCPMTEEDITRQQEELRLGLQGPEEPCLPANENNSMTCLICLEKRATRMCSPCGHAVMCRHCVAHFVETTLHDQALLVDGQIVNLGVRLPLTCPTCRALIGQVVRMFI